MCKCAKINNKITKLTLHQYETIVDRNGLKQLILIMFL